MQLRTMMLRLILAMMVVPTLLVAAPPGNDNFDFPVVLSGFPASRTGTNEEATLEPDEPLPAQWGGVGEASVWYRWTAPISGPVRIDTLGSDFDTLLAVWNGDALSNLTLVAESDQYDGDQSAVFIEAESNETYQIGVYGWNDERGVIALNVTNDLTSRIAGTVTAPDGTTPLPRIEAVAHLWSESLENWEEVARAKTDADGDYSIRGLAAGTYRVQFADEDGNYLGETYDDAADLESGTNIEVSAETTVPGIDASLAIASKIVGTVTGPDGTAPLQGIEVAAFRSSDSWQGWESVAQTQSDEAGNFTIGGLPVGTYRVQFTDPAGGYLEEVYDGAVELEMGTDIAVPVASTVTGIVASLESAAFISGTITGPDGMEPLEGIGVAAYRWDESEREWSWVGQAYSDADGVYVIGGLVAGAYRIQFTDPYSAHVSEVYDDAVDLDSGADIVLSAGATAGGIDASLESASAISGTVTGPDGIAPLAGLVVVAYGWSESEETWESRGQAETDMEGSYAIGGLPAGTYRVQFLDLDGTYAREIYDDAVNLSSGADIVLAEGTTATGIDASLAMASGIAGTVIAQNGLVPLEGIVVEAYCWNETLESWELTEDAQTGADGAYAIGGLPAGTYRVQYSDMPGYYIKEVYDDASDLESGTDIVLTAGTPVDGIDATMVGAGRISGTVTGPDGLLPAEGIEIAAFRWSESLSGWEQLGSAQADHYGAYTISELPEGFYRVQFSDWSGKYLQEVYNDAADLGSGTDIALSAGTTASSIDASLAEPSSASPLTIVGLTQPESGYWEIQFVGEAGEEYTLQETASLTNAWNDVGAPLLCVEGINAITLQATELAAYWGLKASP